jgi:hypothetical protein
MDCATLVRGVKSFDKYLAHDGTLKMCVPLVPKVYAHLSYA